MSLSFEEKVSLGKREALSIKEKWAVDETLETLLTYCKAYGLPVRTDDRLAAVEAALIQYLMNCRK